MNRARLLLAVSVLLPWMAMAGESAPSATQSVELKNFHFSPVDLTVPVGATVRWTNHDEEPHTVASVDGAFRSGALDSDDVFQYKFTRAGTYRYVCSIHPQMAGTIVVK